MTNKDDVKYNKGVPVKCECGKTIGFIKNGKLYIKCRGCNRQVDINERAKSR